MSKHRKKALSASLQLAISMTLVVRSGTADAWAQVGTSEAEMPVTSMALMNQELPIPDAFFNIAVKLPQPVASSVVESPAPTAVQANVQPTPQPQLQKSNAAYVVENESQTNVAAENVEPEIQRENNALGQRLDELTAKLEEHNEELKGYIQAVAKYGDWKYRLGESARDMLNYSCLFKGVSPSSEAGDIILNEKTKLKGLAAAKFMRQKLGDEKQLELVSSVVQLAMAVGSKDAAAASSQFAEASRQLTQLVGEQECAKTVEFLQQLKQASASTEIRRHPLSVADTQKSLNIIAGTAASIDPITADLKEEVHHYNKHSDASLAAHRVTRVTLSAASLTPSFVGPAAQVVLFAYLALSGGTEQEKLLRELYIDKRVSSRANLLTEEAHVALHNHQLAAMTQNQLLLEVTQQLVARMTGASTAKMVLQQSGGAALAQQAACH